MDPKALYQKLLGMFIAGQAETRLRLESIEAKLDLVMKANGIDPPPIVVPVAPPPPPPPASGMSMQPWIDSITEPDDPPETAETVAPSGGRKASRS
jgi:hypothetical protein